MRVSVSVDEFRHGFDNEIGTELQRMLVVRRSKRVVDGKDGAVFMRDLRDGRDVRDAVRRIVRRLDVDEPRPGRDRLFDRLEIRHVGHDRFHAELAVEELVEQAVHRHITDIRIDHAVPRLQQRPEQRMQSRHAAAEQDRIIRTVERRQLFLHPMLVRIAVARIHEEVG